MDVLIRADSSLRIGIGHVMRCLALAERLREDGARVRFACRTFAGNVNELVERRGFRVSALPTAAMDVPMPEWHDPHWESDAVATLRAASTSLPLDWLIVDSYALDARWQRHARAGARHILAIDDLANRPHACDVLLDQNLRVAMHAEYEPLLPPNCRRLLGPRYALLRPEFAEARTNSRARDSSVQRVLVFFGGADPEDQTGKAIMALSELQSPIAIDVLIGPASRNTRELEALCAEVPGATLHREVADVADLMSRADLAIGASGGATWERCCVGLPSVIVSLALNQEASARTLASSGCAIYLGDYKTVSAALIRDTVRSLICDPERLGAMSRACAALVDGRGTGRVRRALDPHPISLRKANRADSEQLYEWRNAEETRRYSFDPKPIPRETHHAWLEQTLNDPDRMLLIAERDARPIGVLRYDVHGMEAAVSVYLVPGQHGQGFGARVLCAAFDWLQSNRCGVRYLRAQVLQENQKSREAFLEAGYRFDGTAFVKSMH